MGTNPITSLSLHRPLAGTGSSRLRPQHGQLGESLAINTQTPSKFGEESYNAVSTRQRAAVAISDAATSLNYRESLTGGQITAIDSLLTIANSIASEVSPQRIASLQLEAQEIISEDTASYAFATEQDSLLSENRTYVSELDPSTPLGTSGRQLSITVSEVQSLSELGVSSELSFDPESIESTITVLEHARSSLTERADQYGSTRTELSSTASELSVKTGQIEDYKALQTAESLSRKVADLLIKTSEPLLANRAKALTSAAALLEDS